jgi:hypothetical protein
MSGHGAGYQLRDLARQVWARPLLRNRLEGAGCHFRRGVFERSATLRILFCQFTVLLLGAGWFSTACCAQPEYQPRKHHRWARFDPDAWSHVQEEAETFDEEGKLVGSSTTETTTTLKAVDAGSVTLEADVTVEISGKRFNAQPKTVITGIFGGDNGQSAKIEDTGTGHVTISEQRIPCQIRRLTVNGGSDKRVTTIYFNDKIAPFELRRETISTDSQEKTLNYQTNATVTATNLPYQVLSEIQTVAFVTTVHTSPKGKNVTIEVHCPRVPGGVVAHWSTEFDDSGRVVHRSVLRLVDYGLTARKVEAPQASPVSFPRRPRRVNTTRSSGIKGR